MPALTVREVDTGVELKAGQTLALAGLIQTRVEAQERGLPFLGDLPYVGAAFRSVEEEVNEIELLILVTPEFADGMEPHEVPPCGPGMETVSPSNCQLYFGSHLEVPACGQCAPDMGCAPMVPVATKVAAPRVPAPTGSCSNGSCSVGAPVEATSSYYTSDSVPVDQATTLPIESTGTTTAIQSEEVEVPAYENLLKQPKGPAMNSSPDLNPGASQQPYQKPVPDAPGLFASEPAIPYHPSTTVCPDHQDTGAHRPHRLRHGINKVRYHWKLDSLSRALSDQSLELESQVGANCVFRTTGSKIHFHVECLAYRRRRS